MKKNEMLSLVIPICGAILLSSIGILWNEHNKRNHEEYLRKEERYMKLISAFKGFSEENYDSQKIDSFINELELC